MRWICSKQRNGYTKMVSRERSIARIHPRDVVGMILHFDDTLLSNYYFLDPQYLAELLAQVIANEQINGLARHGKQANDRGLGNQPLSLRVGLMKISELPSSLEESSASLSKSISILLPLLQKFDLAITWDNQHLIFPPLLPNQLSLDSMVCTTLLVRRD